MVWRKRWKLQMIEKGVVGVVLDAVDNLEEKM